MWRRPASAVGCSSRDWPRPAPWDDVSLPEGFTYDGFPRPDFVGEAELHLVDGKVARVVFRAP